jgi:hypothetical protein
MLTKFSRDEIGRSKPEIPISKQAPRRETNLKPGIRRRFGSDFAFFSLSELVSSFGLRALFFDRFEFVAIFGLMRQFYFLASAK